MPEVSSNNGELLTLYKLLDRQEVTIPIIQRDYAQGRDEQNVEEIRERFLDTLYIAISKNEPIILDFIYGSIRNGTFIPIDGQQRITTLFLLHWYLAVLEKRKPDEYSYLKKFSYEIRESAREFCYALVSNYIDPVQDKGNLSGEIKKANWYHYIYDNDPTVQAMLRMLDAIDMKFRGLSNGYVNLVVKDTISFWWLSLEDFGLTDDLFIKMNARGKRLTRFEIFKAETEQATENFKQDAGLNKIREHWLDSIDNDWLDIFWEQTEVPEENAENRMFRFILFLLRSLVAEDKGKYDEIGNLEYAYNKNDILAICEKDNLEFLCNALDDWNVYAQYQPIKDMFLKIISGEDATFYERAIVFGVVVYGNQHPECRVNDAFFRILNYLAIGRRHVSENRKTFESDFNAENYGSFIRNIRLFINKIESKSDEKDLLQALVNAETNLDTFRYAKEKAEYCVSSDGLDKFHYEEIKKIEDMDCFCGQIYNVFFDGKLWLSSKKIEQLIEVEKTDPHLLLRCIQAMSEKALLTNKYHGSWKWAIAKDKKVPFTLRKEFFGFNASDSGDYLWTANPERDLSKAVRGFVQECVKLAFVDIKKELYDWLLQKIKDLHNYSGLASYIVKYDEFLGDAGNYSNGCVYLIDNEAVLFQDWTRVFINLERGRNYHSFWSYGTHYNPFIMALHKRLEESNAKVRISNEWMCKENGNEANVLDEWIELSNGRKLYLMVNVKRERYWTLDDGSEWDCSNSDCIEIAFQKIIEM